MNVRLGIACLACAGAIACTPNVVSSEDAGGDTDSGVGQDSGTTDAGNPYPAGPYGVSVNRIIQNFTFAGYFTTGSGVKINTLPYSAQLDLQTIRMATDANGKPFRYLLLDISAGWCPPCNQEAQDLGLSGSRSSLISSWLSRGGIFVTVLVEGYNESTEGPPVEADIETWANQHNAQSTLAFDAPQVLLAQGISPSAFPTNLVIDLRTMRIVAAWYGLDSTYQKWEAALNGP